MECNKDEAMRAKIKAEGYFNRNDFASAKRLTLKAQRLHPSLDGLSQMLRTLDVYIFSEMKVNGEPDWYGVLDVKPSDDYKTIKRQYLRLEHMIHPDKNRSVGANDADIIIREAWAVLSDNDKRSAYNEKRNPEGFQQKGLPQSRNSSTESSSANGHNQRSANKATSKPESYSSTSTCQTGAAPVPTQTQTQSPHPTPTPFVYGGDIFWTICKRCKKEYDFFKMFISQILICPNCHISLLASEMPVPMNSTQPTAQTAERAPSSPSPYAQMTWPLSFTQPTPYHNGWAPLGQYQYHPYPQMQVPMTFSHGWVPSGFGPYTPMLVPPYFTQLTAQTNGWVPPVPDSYAQTSMSMNYTQPPAQEPTGWAEQQMQDSKSRHS